jgi:pimeloyl-ACP methyl ester carboxylesterase
MMTASEKIDHLRRRFLSSAAWTAAAAQFGLRGFADAHPRMAENVPRHAAETSEPTETGASVANTSVVLVHGAWADGSGWDRVMAPLQSKGLKTMAAPIPLTSLSNDIAALEEALERTGGPVVLVAHAYSGAVVGACRNERVRGLVFVAALTPDEGETVAEVFYREKSEAPHLVPDRHGLLWIPDDQFHSAWCQNASAEEAALLAAAQRPIAVACIQEKAPMPAWKAKPSWYLVAEDDRMINPATQRFLARRMNAQIQSAKADHAVLITAPEVVVGVILQAVSVVGADPSKERPNGRQHG